MLRRRTHQTQASTGDHSWHDEVAPHDHLRGERVRQMRRVLAVLKGLTWLLLLAALIAVMGQSVFSRLGE